jgi:hypothetical protein
MSGVERHDFSRKKAHKRQKKGKADDEILSKTKGRLHGGFISNLEDLTVSSILCSLRYLLFKFRGSLSFSDYRRLLA